MTLIRMLAFRPEGPAQALAGASPGGAQKPEAAPATAAAPAAVPAPEAPSSADWSALVAELELDGLTRMLALNCALLARSAGLIRLTLDPHNAAAHTRTREQRLAQALSRLLGETMRVEIVTGGAARQPPGPAAETAGQEGPAGAAPPV